MSLNTIQADPASGWLSTGTRRLTNGHTTNVPVGALVTLDTNRTSSLVTGAASPATAALNTVVQPVTARLRDGVYAVARDATASGVVGEYFGGLPSQAFYVPRLLVNGNSSNIARNDRLTAANASFAAVKAGSVGTASYTAYHAIALETATADGVLIPAIVFSTPQPNI